MNNETCNYRSTWSDSGDRGADMAEHRRAFHPDHAHVWADSTYDWEQVGTPQMVTDPDNWPRAMRVTRTVAVQRCTICSLRQEDDASGTCA